MVENKPATVDEILSYELDPAFARRAKIIFENLELNGREKVLEIGCGRGFYLKTLKSVWPGLDVTGVDLNRKHLDKAKDYLGDLEVRLIKEDATRLPFEDRTFDRVIATEILEHIPDDQKAISEMYRVLRPGGIAMVTVPSKNYPFCWDPLNWILERAINWHIPSDIWWLAGIWADHQRLYNKSELLTALKKDGIKIEKVWSSTHYCFPFSHFIFYGIGKNLVEKGLFRGIGRFSKKRKQPFLIKILHCIIKKIDNLNENKKRERVSSVNIVIKTKIL